MIPDQSKIFKITSGSEFRTLALEVFRYQAEQNSVYKEYLQQLEIEPGSISAIEQIPFLPVQFFKSGRVIAGTRSPELEFHSSGTSGTGTSKHFVADAALYKQSFTASFQLFYGPPGKHHILALLPSCLEQKHSSLIYMVQSLMDQSGSNHSGFYLHDMQAMPAKIDLLKRKKDRTILLFGVSYALLELAEHHGTNLNGVTVMETGGMKGRRKELVREELHNILCDKLNVVHIHSEYGMTELLSQAYSSGSGIFRTPPWMKVLIRDIYDPFTMQSRGRSGGINIIDLANLYSCSFIETRDLGSVNPDGSFTVLGRFDHSQVRGCNLLMD